MKSSPSGTSPARRVRDALEPVAALSFHSDPATQAFADVGLTEFFHSYFWSRSSVLGAVGAPVVSATFGVWEPGFVRTNLEVGQGACSLVDIRRARLTGPATAVREVVGDDAELGAVTAALRRGVDAADDTGRALFAANRGLPRPDDPHADLWSVATAWRELRGDSHLAALVAEGVSGIQANILNELDVGYRLGEYTATRNWSSADIDVAADALRERGLIDGDALTEDGVALRDRLERVTDLAVAPAVAVLGDDLDLVVERARVWSLAIVDRGWFPDDGRKRDAG